MSEFIERSKHPELTKAVQDHILGGPAKGSNAVSALPRKHKDEPFNIDTGVNYVPRGDAGHKTP